jgi:hypothetical protein
MNKFHQLRLDAPDDVEKQAEPLKAAASVENALRLEPDIAARMSEELTSLMN